MCLLDIHDVSVGGWKIFFKIYIKVELVKNEDVMEQRMQNYVFIGNQKQKLRIGKGFKSFDV